ncbi:MAG: GNAT family N-acetyltransferase [Bacillota bacterium]
MVKVRLMKPKDTYQMLRWGENKDVRLLHYNFTYNTKPECRMWYYSKKKFLRKKLFGIFKDDLLVGYITFKRINWFFRKAWLGIALDPNYTNQGIGQKALEKFLDIVFEKYFMKSIYLKVASFNTRAISCYKKVGFKIYDVKEIVYEEQQLLLEENRYKAFDYFKIKNNKIYTKYYIMKINRT